MKTQSEKLILIASSPCSFGGVNFSKSETLIKKALDEGHKVYSICYFHGEVEDFAGYDIGACLNGEICADFNKELYKEGIYDAELEGFNKPLKAFLWNDEFKRPRGLIVVADNKEDMQFAKKKFNSRTSIL